MSLIALAIGIVLIVAAVRDSQGSLFSALKADVPQFVVWAAAIIAVGAIGAVPGLKPVSRWLLALVIIVIIVNNYQRLTKGFQDAWKSAGAIASQPATTSSGASADSAATGAASSFAPGSFESAISTLDPHPSMAQ